MGAIDTAMLNMGCAEVGKALGLPTHGYLVATDAKLADFQAGMESARSAVMGALWGINMISGAGMIESLACHSVEKLVMDVEAIAAAQRLRQGISTYGETLATEMFAQTQFSGEFLRLKETRALFRREQQIPSAVIDRTSRTEAPSVDIFVRAKQRVQQLVDDYQQPRLNEHMNETFRQIVDREAAQRALQPA